MMSLFSFCFLIQLELIEYLVANHDRLLPLFGSEAVLGGPTAPSIDGRLPIHYCKNHGELKFLVEHGADPWSLDADGRTLLANMSFEWTAESVELVCRSPTFPPNLVSIQGFSLLDDALAACMPLRRLFEPSVLEQLLPVILEKGTVATEKTPDLLRKCMKRAPERAVGLFPVVSLLNRSEALHAVLFVANSLSWDLGLL